MKYVFLPLLLVFFNNTFAGPSCDWKSINTKTTKSNNYSFQVITLDCNIDYYKDDNVTAQEAVILDVNNNIVVNAFYIRNRSNHSDSSLATLLEEKHQLEPYNIVDKSLGDEVKFFEVKTKDLLGRDFKSTKNFIVKLENIANRFLTQVVAYQNQ